MQNEGQSKGKKPTKCQLLENKYNNIQLEYRLLEEKEQASNRLTAALIDRNLRLEGQLGKAVAIIEQWQRNFIARQEARFNSELAAIERKPHKVCSVINFNTFPLQMQGQLSRYSVSSFTAKHLMPDEKRITIEFEGERHRAVVKSIASPCIYARVSDAIPRIGRDLEYDFLNPIRSQNAMSISPREIAFAIMQSFSPSFDAKRYGVINPQVVQRDIELTQNMDSLLKKMFSRATKESGEIGEQDFRHPIPRPGNGINCFGVLAFEGSLDDFKTAAAADQGRSLNFITKDDTGIVRSGLAYLRPRLHWMFKGMKTYAETRKRSAQSNAVEVEQFPPAS
jgi:hypothetical protein